MLPSSLYELRTYADELEENDEQEELEYPCPSCPRDVPSTGLVSTAGLPGDLPDFVCHVCASGPFREALAEQEAAAASGVAGTWESEEGIACKNERNNRIAGATWAILPGSPLTPACQAEWVAYIGALHRITVDFSGPSDLVWPEAPALVYADPV